MEKRLFLIFWLFCVSCSSINKVEFKGSRSLSSITLSDTCLELIKSFQKSSDNKLKKSLVDYTNLSNTLSERERLAVDALYFIDQTHSSKELRRLYDGSKNLEKTPYPFRYNGKKKNALFNLFRSNERSKWNEPAVFNFREAREWLWTEQPEFNFESFKITHSKMMKDKIEGLSANSLGVVRNANVFGNARNKGVSLSVYDNIVENPYLDFNVKNRSKSRVYGEVQYPNARTPGDAIEFIKDSHPEVYNSVKNFNGVDFANITKKYVSALTEERFERFKNQREELGDIDTPEKAERLIELVALFQRDIVSIHPFENGNGRTTREFIMNYALVKEGLPPSRVSSPDVDIYGTEEEWIEEVKAGVINSVNIVRDFNYRSLVNLNVDTSPFISYGDGPKILPIDYKKYYKNEAISNYTTTAVDTSQYAEFILRAKLNEGEEKEKFEQFFKNNNIWYWHKKQGQQLVSLNFADTDFKLSFGLNTSKKHEAWKYKISRWYYDNSVVWRGLSRKNEEVSEDEIVSMFTKLHSQVVSNNVARKLKSNTSQEDIKNYIFQDFEQYNKDLLSSQGDLVEMAVDHSETGPKYGVSYGYSTSKNRSVGKAFAMGAMVIADYGQQHEFQHLLKSRVLVGMYQSKKDVDLTRLKQLRNDFSYSYGRQQEVMGIGGADPDSVMIVQTIDAEGDTIKSYVRNINKADEVLVIDGEVEDVNNPPMDRVEKVISLF